MHTDLVEALRDGDLQPLREWLADHHVETSTLHELPQWNLSHFPDFMPASRRLADRTQRVKAEVLAELPKAATAPGGIPLLLLFVLLAVEKAWEISYHYQPMWDTLRGTRACLLEHGGLADRRDARLIWAVLALMKSLEAQIEAENAMTTGQSAWHESALATATVTAREAAELVGGAGGIHPDLTEYVAYRAAEYETYNEVVATAVRGVRRFLDRGDSLASTLAVLENAEHDGAIADPAYVSELRANRFSLLELDARRDDPWLRVDQGTVVYLYPFAVRGVPPQTVVAVAGQQARAWSPGGVEPVEVSGSLHLDDVWDGSDWLDRCYDGAVVELPGLVMRSVDGHELGRFEVQIRFSKLGNHYVRFCSDIEDAGPSDLYAMMLRGAPEHGTVRAAFDGSPHVVWPRLSDLAVQLVQDVCRHLRESEDAAQVQAVARPGMFQVIVSIDAASTTRGPALSAPRREVRSVAELLEAVGAQALTNPVTHLIGSQVEWARYDTDNDLSTTIAGLTGEQTICTSNTVVIAALGAAAFTQGTRRSVAEFSASLDGLFAGWSLELADHYVRVNDFQARVDAAEHEPRVSTRALGLLARELDAEKIRLNDFATQARSTIALIRSPSLLASPVVAENLRLLLEHSGFPQRVAELNSMIEEVAHEQLASTLEKLARQREEQEAKEEQRRENKQRAKLEVFLAVIAAAGISGVIQVLQAGFFESDIAARWAVAGVSVILSVALLLGFVFWPNARRNP